MLCWAACEVRRKVSMEDGEEAEEDVLMGGMQGSYASTVGPLLRQHSDPTEYDKMYLHQGL